MLNDPWLSDEKSHEEIYHCACSSLGHVVCGEWDEDWPEEGFSFSFSLFHYDNIFRRLWKAIKYVCGCKWTARYDYTTLRVADAERLHRQLGEYLDFYRKKEEDEHRQETGTEGDHEQRSGQKEEEGSKEG